MSVNNIPETGIGGALPAHPIMVILVDDQPMIAESLRRMLDDEDDIDFHYCPDASMALSAVCQIRPTLIVQDLIMPHVDGLDLVRQYRAHPECREIPIIVLSSREEPKTKAEAFAAGANDYVVKLPDKLELVARIRYHSQWYIHKLQRDDAYRSLQESQRRLRHLNLNLLHLSTHDSLTNIPNRYHFDQIYGSEWWRANREKQPLSIIMIDIDFFKNYNDKMGHQPGDQCLTNVADTLKSAIRRPADVIARYGGEEFVALLPGTDARGAKTLAEKMREKVETMKTPHPDSRASKYVTISVGVAGMVPNQKYPPASLIQKADKALYLAKKTGRNRTVIAGRKA
ncbi:MAG: diguanylate cyclase [Mariprofundaceae bacterium]